MKKPHDWGFFGFKLICISIVYSSINQNLRSIIFILGKGNTI